MHSISKIGEILLLLFKTREYDECIPYLKIRENELERFKIRENDKKRIHILPLFVVIYPSWKNIMFLSDMNLRNLFCKLLNDCTKI